MKPYVSKLGRNWIVLNSNGDDAFVTTNRELAFAYFRENYKKLLKNS